MIKKINSAFAPIFLLLFIVLVTACNNEPETPSVLQLVSSTGQNYVSENRNVSGGTPVITGVFAQSPTSNVSLTKFLVTFNHDSLDKQPPVIYLDSTLAPDTKNFAMQVAYTPRNLANKEIWKFIITDSNNNTYQRVISIKTTTTVNKADSRYYTYKDVLLSRVKNPRTFLDSLGCIGFSSATGTSFPAYAAKQPEVNKQIDLLFNNTGTQKPSLSLMGSDSLALTALTPNDFDAIDNAGEIRNSYPATLGANKFENLKDGQVLAYKTTLNKIGLLRINKVYRTLDSLAIDVKVEK
ncbi:hypothetical protein [Adhaeribacter radiodurans]|uniref:Uncharacterized protein n=1 Tax=Adhaeribacter radiodurans TaxID=2745197 RepID=A0A7L7L1X8_9BACT|nr:hypothetical protein [Adhaeribacter radiodurans]QMU26773.1 hypothetical protein HUW48_01410 [Adhaeribacter radiodurans]